MAETAQTDAATDQPQDAAEPHGETQQVDWEARYREAVSHSREWEKRAKDNKAAADELQQLRESRMSEAQKAQAKADRLQKELDALKAAQQATAWRSQVADETGLPASLITGDSLESMQAHAKAIGEYVESRLTAAGGGYRVADPTATPNATPNAGDWLRDQFLNQQ